jgi:hypothetical protein
LKILFNGGEDGDAIPLENLENPRYFKLLAINAAYHLSTKKLIEYYKSEIATSASTNVVIQADRSKSIYHSEHTVPNSKQPTDGRTHPIDLPDCDAILRILRLRHDRAAIDFLHKEFKRRNEPCNTVFEQKPLYEFPFRDNVSTDSFEEYHLDTPTSPTMRPTSPFSGPRVMRETKIFQTGKN